MFSLFAIWYSISILQVGAHQAHFTLAQNESNSYEKKKKLPNCWPKRMKGWKEWQMKNRLNDRSNHDAWRKQKKNMHSKLKSRNHSFTSFLVLFLCVCVWKWRKKAKRVLPFEICMKQNKINGCIHYSRNTLKNVASKQNMIKNRETKGKNKNSTEQ